MTKLILNELYQLCNETPVLQNYWNYGVPLGPDVYDFYPLIEFMWMDIRDELLMYTKLFKLSSGGVLMNARNRIIKGNFRA